MLLVADTYQKVKQAYPDYIGKVGDLCADCVMLFRRLVNFDKVKEEECPQR